MRYRTLSSRNLHIFFKGFFYLTQVLEAKYYTTTGHKPDRWKFPALLLSFVCALASGFLRSH